MSSKSEQRIVIRTQRLVIRKACSDDAIFLCALWNNPEVMRYVGFPKGLGITEERIRQDIAGFPENEFDQYLMIELEGRVIGQCKLGLPDQEGVARTDLKLDPAYHGKGYGSEVKQELVDYLFEHTDCVCVEGTPNRLNTASIRMQERVGGRRVEEGVFKPPPGKEDRQCEVPFYRYLVYRSDWEKNRSTSRSD